MPMKTTYQIGDDGDELQVAMFLGEFQVCGAIIPLTMLTPDEAYELARDMGEMWLQSAQGGTPVRLSPNTGQKG